MKIILFLLTCFQICFVFGSRKGVKSTKSKSSRFQVTPFDGQCSANENLEDQFRNNMTVFQDLLTTEIEEKLREISKIVFNALKHQAKCSEENEQKLKLEMATKCAKSVTLPPSTTTQTPLEMCDNDNCKSLSAKMLHYIDHSVDPCEDFYSYACGGVEKDNYLEAEDSAKDTDQRLIEELESLDPENFIMGSARYFYDTCKHRFESPFPDKYNLNGTRLVVHRVGKFLIDDLDAYSEVSVQDDSTPTNLTYMLATFMKHHFTPFFDISVDPDASDNERFVLTIGFPQQPFPLSDEADLLTCVEKFRSEIRLAKRKEKTAVDLNKLYKKLQECKLTSGLDTKLRRMTEAVTTLDLLDFITNLDLQTRFIQAMKQKTEVFLKELAGKMPSQIKIKQSFSQKDYQVQTLQELGNQINWEEFVYILTGKKVKKSQKVLIYNQKELADLLTVLYYNWNLNPKSMNNVLMMMWSNFVYSRLASPLRRSKDYCLQATKILLPDIASALYIHSFPDVHLTRLQQSMSKKVEEIKNEFSTLLTRISSTDINIVLKIQNVNVNIGAFFDATSSNESLQGSVKGMELGFNHAQNVDYLLRRHRRLLYGLLDESTNSPRAMWLKGIVPYAKKEFYLHETNSMFIPIGVLGPPFLYYRKSMPKYIDAAGIDRLIANLFVQLIDDTGLKFNGHDRESLPTLMPLVAASECLGERIGNKPFALNYDGIEVSYKTKHDRHLVLDDVLTALGGTSLAWMSYIDNNDHAINPDDISKTKENPLIWMGSEPLDPIKAFFLRVAQTECKSSSNFDIIEIMESGRMPTKHKINLIMQNEFLFQQAFQCSKEAKMNPKISKCPFIFVRDTKKGITFGEN